VSEPLTWVKEAELHAKKAHFVEAAKCIDSAKRREDFAEDEETLWKLIYWDLLISIVLKEFKEARAATKRLYESGFTSRQSYPRGYIWKESARQIKPRDRSFREYAKIWGGRVQDIRSGGRYGRISLINSTGETFYIDFRPQYFSRRDFRRGEYVNFVMTILPNNLRADDIDSDPFRDTVDDLFIPDKLS